MEITFKPSKRQFEAWEYLTDDIHTEIGYGGGACFAPDTLVLTENGYLQIEDIQKGTRVFSLNEETKELELKEVINTPVFGGGEVEQDMVQLVVHGETITTTPSHEFYIRGTWLPIKTIRERILEICGGDERTLLNLNGRTFNDKELEKYWQGFNNETCLRCTNVFENNDSDGRETKNNKDAQTCSTSISSQSEGTSESQELQQERQQATELGMGDEQRELDTLRESGENATQGISREVSTSNQERFGSRNVNTDRGTSIRDTETVCTEKGNACNSCRDVQSKSGNNKRYCYKEKLEAFELDVRNIESISLVRVATKVHDLEVQDNANYIVSRNNIIVHNSGGKSYLGCVWATSMCLAYPNTGWLIGRRELTNLKKTTLLTLFKVFKEFGITEGMYNYNQQNNIITFNNQSQIFLMDLDYKPSDPLYTRLGGLELTGAFIDESNECPEEAINTLKTRLGRRGTLKPKLLETFNPSKNHVYKRYYKPSIDNTMPTHRVFIKALATDNPHTTEAYLEQLKNADVVTRERLLNGNFEYDDDPNALIDTEAIYDLFTNTVEKGEKFLTADVARYGQDKTVIYCWNGLEVYKAFYYEKQGLDVTSQKLKEILSTEQIPYSHAIVDEDGIGGGVVDTVKGVKGFIANTKPFDIIETRLGKPMPANFQNLKTQCYFKLADLINTHKMAVKVDDGYVKNQIAEELQYVKQKQGDGKLSLLPKSEVKEYIGRSPDFSDALMMRMFFEFDKPTVRTAFDVARTMQARINITKSWSE